MDLQQSINVDYSHVESKAHEIVSTESGIYVGAWPAC